MDLVRLVVTVISLILVVGMIGGMVLLLVVPSVGSALLARTSWVNEAVNGGGTRVEMSSPLSAGTVLMEAVLGKAGWKAMRIMVGSATLFLLLLVAYNLLMKVLSGIG
ncbi:hypothetical protein CCP3SC15_1240009 [Gammaproteobacteria bacterium]